MVAETYDTKELVRDFKPLLRRAQAEELAARFGVEQSTFRVMFPPGHEARLRLIGGRDHYHRDKMVAVLEGFLS